jgi:FkbM family methyltransferase
MGIRNLIIDIVETIPFAFRGRIKNIPGLKQIQALALKKWMSDKSFIATISGGPARGLVFPVHMPQDKQMWIGTWELDFAKTLQQAVKPGWVCYDIGGYKGYYAGVMALKGSSSVQVFEPMPENITNIEKLISLNAGLPIVLQKFAVADKSGQTSFKIMPEQTMGKLSDSLFQTTEEAVRELKVNCITLDDFVAGGNPVPDFIKVDVEGAEDLVLKGAIGILERKKPMLMIEVHSHEIGIRCMSILETIYSSIKVLETGLPPDEKSPAICHYIAKR